MQLAKAARIIPYIHDRMNVIEVGSGDGSLTQLIAPHCRSIIGIDNAKEAKDIAEDNNQLHNVNFINSDLMKYENNFVNDTDAIVCMDVIEHIPYELHGATLRKLCSMVRQGGWLFFGTSPIKDNLLFGRNVKKFGENGDDPFRLSKRQAVKLVEHNGFRVVEVKVFDTYTWFPGCGMIKGEETFLTNLPFVGKFFASHVLVVAQKVVK